jgi:hypothetical protein
MAKRARGWEKVVGRRKRPVRAGRRSSPPGKRRLLVTEKTGPEIELIIQNWPLDGDLNWDSLMDLLNRRYGGEWTRQAVAKHDFLQEAFTLRQTDIAAARQGKTAKKAGQRKTRTRDEEVAYLKQQLELANKEVTDLKVQLGIAENRMARWRHNAQMHRVTIRQLDAPLQENDRGRSDR